jgi:hypothetical protein
MYEHTCGITTTFVGIYGFGIAFTHTFGLIIVFTVARGFAVVFVCIVSLTLESASAYTFSIVYTCTQPCHHMSERSESINVAQPIPLHHPTSLPTKSPKKNKPCYLKQVPRVPTSDIQDKHYLLANDFVTSYTIGSQGTSLKAPRIYQTFTFKIK